jgi:molecular chaperone DnaK
MLADQADQVADEDKAEVEEALSGLKAALESEDDDMEAISKATETLTEVSQSFSQKLYEAAAQQADDGTGETSDSVDDVVDAEIIDEDQ